MDRQELESMTVAELKKLLEESSLSKSGRKSELIDRLLESSLTLDDDDDFLILEEEDIEDKLEIEVDSAPTPSKKEEIEVMEATILDAVLVEEELPPEKPTLKLREETLKKSEPMIEIKIHALGNRRNHFS